MGATVQRNVCNCSIIRRFGHSQKRGEEGRDRKEKKKAKFEISETFCFEGADMTLYKIIHKKLRGAFCNLQHWQLLKYADDKPTSSHPPIPGVNAGAHSFD